MIEKILEQIRSQEMNITGWLLGFSGILFVRFLLESISSPTYSGVIPSDPFTLVHYLLYFVTVTLGTILIFGHFIKEYKASSKIILFGLSLTWLAPIIDIVISKGMGLKMLYIFDSGKDLVRDFLTFFGPDLFYGATIGIRVVIFISLLTIGYLTWVYTKKDIQKTLFSIIFIYLFVFVIATLPGIIFTVSNPNSGPATNSEIVFYIEKVILNSNILHNTLHEGMDFVSRERFLELSFNKFISQILFLISSILALFLFSKINKEKFIAVLKNVRLERINFYNLSLLSGMGFAFINGLVSNFVLTDILTIVCLLISWGALWMNAVHLNDIYDLEIDEISNTERPLVKKILDKKQMKDIGNLWLTIGLTGAFICGFYPFFMALVYTSCSYIYSVPPLRLRRFPIVPSFLIGIACLSTILAGFFLLSEAKDIKAFPPLLAVGIVIMVTLAINFKDVKDIEGDKKAKVMTIPVLFPKNGVKIVALLFSLSILLVPIFLSFYLLFVLSVPASIIGYKIITKKPYNERNVFILRFFFLGGIALSYLLLFLISKTYSIV